MKHRFLALLCAAVLTFSAIPAASALPNEALRAADTLATLNMVHGTAQGDYLLNAPATRAHAAVLLVRLSGQEAAAKADPWYAGHRDLPAWAAPSINYAIHQGWINNEPFELDFHPEQAITANAWCAALLNMMGFTDFEAEDAAAFAQRVGVISQPCKDPLTRGDLFKTALDALQYTVPGQPSLSQRLVDSKVISRSAANALGLLDTTLTARQAADRHMSAVFQLNGFSDEVQLQAEMPVSNASGFFISSDGLAVTNYHSIDDITAAQVVLSTGETYPVEGVVFYDTEMDLAVIRVSPTSTSNRTTSAFATLELVGSQDLRPGDQVYALGNPLGLGLAVAEGVVSAKGHQVERYSLPCIVNTASISHGSSGGALMNVFGQVVGVTSGSYARGNNMYIAVPVDPILSLDLSGEAEPLPAVYAREKNNA